jgi:hypothetical protein
VAVNHPRQRERHVLQTTDNDTIVTPSEPLAANLIADRITLSGRGSS